MIDCLLIDLSPWLHSSPLANLSPDKGLFKLHWNLILKFLNMKGVNI